MSSILATTLGRDFGKAPSVNRAVGEISLEIPRGELFGLIGPDGAGKTTLLRMMAGLLPPTRGSVRVEGIDPFGKEADHARDVIGLVPQEHSLYGDLSVGENLDFFADLYGLTGDDLRTRRDRLLSITRLGPFQARRASQLSGGMYKKLAVACALLHQPEVLLLDEPTNGVDPPSRRELWELLYEFVEGGMTVVVTTPYMDEATRCHRVALMDRGEFIALAPPQQLIDSLDAAVLEVALASVPEAREKATAVVEASPLVVASSPLGASLRVVVERGNEPAVAAELAGLGTLVPAAASFEDLFLTAIARRERDAKSSTARKEAA
ncbi:MAG: ABC transporter ATP-binding protein [Sandaracinaceae bacterium]|nr:ABC transporter ATP-binding protein [Sandaracinaceae bacterium]